MGDLPVDLEDLLSWKKLGYLVACWFAGCQLEGLEPSEGFFLLALVTGVPVESCRVLDQREWCSVV
jgi:hypothetical protein